MKTELVKQTIPNIPVDIIDQLARVNEEPAIHRYVQLHNSFELVVRYLAITSYLWVEKTEENEDLLAGLARTLHRPSLNTWNEIFTSCAKWLHDKAYIDRSPKDDIKSGPAMRVLQHVAELTQISNGPKKASSTGLMQSIIEYRNLTRGHGCVIHRGYESLIEDIDEALFDFMVFWAELLNVKSICRTSGVVLRLGGEDVPAGLFLGTNEAGRLDFYNRRETSRDFNNYYFLNYDTGLHRLVPEQRQRIQEEIRLHQGRLQLALFPTTKADVEKKFGRREVSEIRKFLSYNYGETQELHPAQEEEIRFLVGLRKFSNTVRDQDPLAVLLASMKSEADLRDVYYDFADESWKSLSEYASKAIEEYLETAELDEIVNVLMGRVQDGMLDDDEREEVLETVAAIERFLKLEDG